MIWILEMMLIFYKKRDRNDLINKKIVQIIRDCYTGPSTFEEEVEGGWVFVIEEEVDGAEELAAAGSVDKEEV